MGDKNTFFPLIPGEVVYQLLTEEITGCQGGGGTTKNIHYLFALV